MNTITFLGTGCMQPTKQRNHSAIILSTDKENLLFDCGEGTQRQIRFANLKPTRITRIFLSHWHGDHVFGLPGLMSAMAADNFKGTLTIYGPTGTKTYLKNLLKSFAYREIVPFTVQEIDNNTIIETETFTIEAKQLKHSVPCIGFRFQEKDRRRIDLVKAKKWGLEGPILGQLQKGKTVQFRGKKIKPNDVTYIVKGKKISYIADTIPCPGANFLAKDADILISEGTHLDDVKQGKYMHLTVHQAAEIAAKNGAKKLIITHISQRYKNATDILHEAQKHFKNVIVAEDFLKLKV